MAEKNSRRKKKKKSKYLQSPLMKFILWSENLKAQSFMRFPVLTHLTMLLQLPQFYFFSVFCVFPAHLTAASDSLKKKKKKG